MVEAEGYKLWFQQVSDSSPMTYVTATSGENFQVSYGKTKFVEPGKNLQLVYQGYLIGLIDQNPDVIFRMGIKSNGSDQVPVEMAPFAVGSHVQKATYAVPSNASTMSVWFEAKLPNGEIVFDSNFGLNYDIEVQSPATATVCFDQNWGESVSQNIQAGRTIAIAYDRQRILSYLDGSTFNGMPIYSLTGYVRFTNQQGSDVGTFDFPLELGSYTANGNIRKPFKPIVRVPVGATKAAFWFRGAGRGRPHFDSNQGENYNFSVR